MTAPALTDAPRVLFMGTPAFAVPSLQVLCENGFTPAAIVTGPDRRRGRGRRSAPTAIRTAAHDLGIGRVLQPEDVKDADFAREVCRLACDIQVVVAFRILPRAVFREARLGAFNLHASLLPRYRGAAPINRALMAGEQTTGVTTFFLAERVDTGNMILQWSTHIDANETAGELHDRLSRLGARAVLETVRRIASDRAGRVLQNPAAATAAPKIFRHDCRINWHLSAQVLHNHCRGLSPRPGAWTMWQGRLVKVLNTRVCEGTGEPGTVVAADTRLAVACGAAALEIRELQLQGKRRLPAGAFLRGHPITPGDRLE
ncbi:MAG: methionyl-tRNA formyltransferase [Bacteroidota bacterium]|nr:methionyl-tRNA formyltransferase [Bacteroidota bacterium]